MFKTHLRINKPIVTSFALAVGAVVVLLVNIVTLLPSLLTVYKTQTPSVRSKTIDTKSVNDAIELLNK